MQQESAKLLGDAAVMISVGTGVTTAAGNDWLTHLNNNAPAYGVLMTLVFGLCGIAFYILSYKKQTLADTNAAELAANAGEMATLKKEVDRLTKIIDDK